MPDRTARHPLIERIDLALRTTPSTGNTHTPGQEKFDHHPRPGEKGHRYTYTCALCRSDTEALAKALVTVFTDELKADWSRYRGRVLAEVWEALRDAESGPLIDGMGVVNKLLEETQ
ncbi:hypothetical protein ACFV2X_38370 [Streptomyces sp. NPDC059679]|uniref:hypothetical protein n=1 Tax=Streptomyces sp. NPDC059679 TaxID=3346903 RepID=UPI0036A395E5